MTKDILAWRDVQNGVEVEAWDLVDGARVSRLPAESPVTETAEQEQKQVKQVIFRPIPDDSEDSYPGEPLQYSVIVDEEEVVRVAPDNLCLESVGLDPLWEKLGIELMFEELEIE